MTHAPLKKREKNQNLVLVFFAKDNVFLETFRLISGQLVTLLKQGTGRVTQTNLHMITELKQGQPDTL